MTGRKLYDHYCDAVSAVVATEEPTVPGGTGSRSGAYVSMASATALAWPFLSDLERAIWNEAAKRATPRR